MSRKLPIALIAAAACFASPAMAQTVYRCGDSYVQKPCPGGKAIDVEDSRNASQRADTLEATKRTGEAANAMEKARLAEEAKPAQVLLPPERPQVDAKEEKVTVVRAPVARKKAAPKPKATKNSSKKREKKAPN